MSLLAYTVGIAALSIVAYEDIQSRKFYTAIPVITWTILGGIHHFYGIGLPKFFLFSILAVTIGWMLERHLWKRGDTWALLVGITASIESVAGIHNYFIVLIAGIFLLFLYGYIQDSDSVPLTVAVFIATFLMPLL